jgi:phage tail sheath gpL-like
MASLVLTIKGSGVSGLQQDSSCDHIAIQDITNHLHALASGNEKGTVYCSSSSSDPVAASGTITVASISADDTITVGNVTFTGKSSPAGATQFDSDGTDATVATAIAAAINAHSTLSKVVSAAAVNAVVTVTCLVRGVVGNCINLSSSNGTRLAVSAANLAGGTGGAESASPATYAFGQ